MIGMADTTTLKLTDVPRDTIELTFNFDAQLLSAMLNDDTIPRDDKTKLSKFNKAKKNHNTFVDKYKYSYKHIGRMYSTTQDIPKEYRNDLLGDNILEIDMTNCHPVLLMQIGEKYNTLSVENIKYYVEHREECLKETHEDREAAKQFYLRAMYKADMSGYEGRLDGFCKEVSSIMTMMNGDDVFAEIKKYAKTEFKKKPSHKSELHSFASYVLQTYENRIMLALYNYLQENDITVKLLNHDGILVDGSTIDFDGCKEEMEAHIYKNTGFRITLGSKKWESKYIKPINKYIVVKSEQEAVNYLAKHYKHAIKRGVDGFYTQTQYNKHYEKGENGLRTLVKSCDFRKMNTKGDILPFSATTKGMKDIIEYINKNSDDLFPIDDKFIESVHNYTRHKLYYLDKYLDMRTGVIHDIPDDKLPIYYEKRLAPEPHNYTAEMKENYKTKYLNMYNKQQLQNVLQMTARAVAGIRDKNWTILSGLRNSGKGVYQRIVEHSFGEYCCTIELPMCKTQNSGDASQYRSILNASAHIKRIAFTNEATSIEGKKLKIDGNAIKKFVSGGDVVKCRGLYKDEVDVVFNTHLFVNVNSIPESEPADAMMTCLPIKMPYKFVDDVIDEICERPTDHSIKDKITAEDPDLFTMIVLDAYRDSVVLVKDLCEDDQDEYRSNIMSNASEPTYILNNKLVKDVNGWISTSDLTYIFKPSGMNSHALGKFLKARMTPSQRRIDKKPTHGYTGYRIVEEVSDDSGEDGSDVDEL